MKKLISRVIFSAFVALLIISGCEQTYTQNVRTLAVGPDLGAEPSGYAAQAFEAAGGFDAWAKVKELQLNCVVSFYQPDGSYYLTQQRYEIFPWSNSIRISSSEPQNTFIWQFTKGQFKVLKGGMAELILNIVTSPVRFMDPSVEFSKEATPVKMYGQWYYLIDRKSKLNVASAERLSDAVFYQNRDTFVTDMIWFPRISAGRLLMVRGYDFERIEEDILIPTKIEISRTDALGISQELLVKINVIL
jgi:hypothetical protein